MGRYGKAFPSNKFLPQLSSSEKKSAGRSPGGVQDTLMTGLGFNFLGGEAV
jgi:hypothetical protein